VKRGGDWSNDADYCRVANRSGNSPGNEYDYLGFRRVRAAQ
jgi:formylglycine-generating enzyme required for sulfatase activity